MHETLVMCAGTLHIPSRELDVLEVLEGHACHRPFRMLPHRLAEWVPLAQIAPRKRQRALMGTTALARVLQHQRLGTMWWRRRTGCCTCGCGWWCCHLRGRDMTVATEAGPSRSCRGGCWHGGMRCCSDTTHPSHPPASLDLADHSYETRPAWCCGAKGVRATTSYVEQM
jgi:hypothetical protein